MARVPLKQRPRLRLVVETPEPLVDIYATAPLGARLRVDELAVKVRLLQRAFSGSFITVAMLEECRRLADEIAREAAALPSVLG